MTAGLGAPIEPFSIRRLEPSDAAALAALRRQALESAPLAFSSSPQDDRARSLDFHVYVSATGGAAAAMDLYEQLGFAVWGIDAASLRVGGRLVAERHMVLALGSSA